MFAHWGVVLGVLVAAPGSAQQVCREARLQEELALGAEHGVQIDVRGLAVGPEGSLYISQVQTPYVLTLERDGTPTGRIGRQGQGPGEFEYTPGGLGFLGDTLWVSMAEAWGRIHYFTADGTFVRRVSGRTALDREQVIFATTWRPFDDGRYLAGIRWPFNAAQPTDPDQPLIVLDATGAVLDTIAIYPHMPVPISFGRSWGRHPLHRYLRPTMTRDGSEVIWVDDRPAEQRFVLMSGGSDGSRRELFSVAYAPIPLSGRARERVLDDYGARRSAGESGVVADMRYREGVETLEPHLGDYFPPVRSMVAGRDGTIWLLREERDDDVDIWEVYRPDGTMLKSVYVDFGRYLPSYLAPRIDIHDATATEVWASTRGALDEVTLHRFRVVPSCEAN